MPPVNTQVIPQEQTTFQKLKMGALYGSLVGLTIGFLFGGFAIVKNGAGPRGFLPTLSSYMLGSGATFGFFMSIGSVVRSDGLSLTEWAQKETARGIYAYPPRKL